MATYKLVVGCDYPDASGAERHANAGDEVVDLPAKSISWLREQGLIAIVSDLSPTAQPVQTQSAKES